MDRGLLVVGLVCGRLVTSSPCEARQPAAAPGTADAPVVLTLAQVLDLAVPESETLSMAQAAQRQAEAQRRVAGSGRFPQISASATYLRTLRTEFAGLLPEAPDDDGGGGRLPFGRDNAYRFGASASQTLYSGGRIGADRAIASAGARSAAESVVTAHGQALLEASRAYYDAALASRFVAIAEAVLAQAEATLRQAELAFQAGSQPEFEVLRARVARDNERPALIRARLDRELALLRLRQLIDFPPRAAIRLAEDLDAAPLLPPAPFAADLAALEPPAPALETVSDEPAPRAAVRQVAADLERQRASLRRVRAERWPAVSLVTDYERVTYPADVVSGFGDLRTNWTLGAFLQVPVFTGGRQAAQEAAARAQVEAQQARLAQADELADLDARAADAALEAAAAVWSASLATVEQAQRTYEIAEVRYRAGVSTQLELSDARLQWQQAGVNRAQAARDLQMARVRRVLLPRLPLSASAVPGVAGAMPAPAAGGTSPAAGAATPAAGASVPASMDVGSAPAGRRPGGSR